MRSPFPQFGSLLVALGLVLVPAGCTKAPTPVAPALPSDAAFPDIDAMAERLPHNVDRYRQIRDQALAVFARREKHTSADGEVETLIRLHAYLWVWGDVYREGLWPYADRCSLDALNAGCSDWLVNWAHDEVTLGSSHSASEADAQRIAFAANQLFGTDYPAPFKMQAAQAVACDLVNFKVFSHGDPSQPSFRMLPAAIKVWGAGYRELLKEHWPRGVLFDAASNLLCNVQSDQDTLDAAIAEIDAAFNDADPGNPLKLALDGDYQVQSAWCARGSGWSNSVSDDGWKSFAGRLTKADEILENGYAKNPEVGEFAQVMMNVELGQGQGRERFETWYNRAVKADPDDYEIYKAKEWYLQPRWYGSEADELEFGQECLRTDKWSSAIPMVLAVSVAEMAQQDPKIYARDDIWNAVDPLYREFLRRYPHSIGFRTAYAEHAFDGDRFDIAHEQMKILGDEWDRDTITQSKYENMKGVLSAMDNK